MKLVQLELRGFRRFFDAKMNMEPSLLVIVGPNEAGKTSVLEALKHLDTEDEFGYEDLSRTSDGRVGEHILTVSVRYALEETDLHGIENLELKEKPRWFVARKDYGGSKHYSVEPPAERDLSSRQELVERFQRVLAYTRVKKVLDRSRSGEDLHFDTLRAALEKATEILDSDDNQLSTEQLEDLAVAEAEFRSGLDIVPEVQRDYLRDVGSALEVRLGVERLELTAKVVRHLQQFEPRFLFFADAERNLNSEYNPSVIANPPAALRNLLRLAGVDLRRLNTAYQNDDHPARLRSQTVANQRLREVFSEGWLQSDVWPVLHLEPEAVRIQIQSSEEDFSSLGERSAGLQTFVALAAFISTHDTRRDLVLLVDEAETHLHYDAQADLIRMFEEQRLAKKIVYTTHSAGALPSDLGTPVRVVTPTPDESPHSSIHNGFWSVGGAGFSPLLLGMGASAVAFSPARRAVLAEGASDVILLPVLLKQAQNLERLGFQVVPGLASISREDAGEIDLQAPRIAYVLDGDAAGDSIRRLLIQAGVEQEAIIQLSTGRQIEDLIAPEVFTEAVNRSLRWSHGDQVQQLAATDLPARGRFDVVGDHCDEFGLNCPNKTAIAQAIAIRGLSERVFSRDREAELDQLYSNICQVLGLDA